MKINLFVAVGHMFVEVVILIFLERVFTTNKQTEWEVVVGITYCVLVCVLCIGQIFLVYLLIKLSKPEQFNDTTQSQTLTVTEGSQREYDTTEVESRFLRYQTVEILNRRTGNRESFMQLYSGSDQEMTITEEDTLVDVAFFNMIASQKERKDTAGGSLVVASTPEM